MTFWTPPPRDRRETTRLRSFRISVCAALVGGLLVVAISPQLAGAVTGVGSPDSGFGAGIPAGVAQIPGLSGSMASVAYDPNSESGNVGDVVAAGYELSSSLPCLAVARYTSAGSPDSTFHAGPVAANGLSVDQLGNCATNAGTSEAQGVAVYPASATGYAGDVVAVGYEQPSNGVMDPVLVRFTASGALDASFNSGVATSLGALGSRPGDVSELSSVAIDAAGDVIAVGSIMDAMHPQGAGFVVEVSPTGSISTLTDGTVRGETGIALDNGGNAYLSGVQPYPSSSCTNAVVTRVVLSSLTVDTSFGTSGYYSLGTCPGLALSTGGIAVQGVANYPQIAVAASTTSQAAVIGLDVSPGGVVSAAPGFPTSPNAGLEVLSNTPLVGGTSVAFITDPSTVPPTPLGIALGGEANVGGTDFSAAVAYLSLTPGGVTQSTSFGNDAPQGTDDEVLCSGSASCGTGLAGQPDGSILIAGNLAGSSGSAIAVARLLNRAVSVTGPGTIGITASPSPAPFTVSLNAASIQQGESVSVSYATAAGTASAGTNFTSISGTLTLPCTPSESSAPPPGVSCATGANSATVFVPLAFPATATGNLTFSLVLSNPAGAGLGTASATATLAYPQVPTPIPATTTTTTVASTPTTVVITTTRSRPKKSTAVKAGAGYWVLSRSGRVYAYGDARNYGSVPAKKLIGFAVAIASTHDGKGYWIASSRGRVYAFGDARTHGFVATSKLSGTIRAFVPTTSGTGYWLLSSTGAIYTFGSAKKLRSPVKSALSGVGVGLALSAKGKGYWLGTTSGAVYRFGSAKILGSLVGRKPKAPLTSFIGNAAGTGFWFVSSIGGVVGFGAAKVFGALPKKGVSGSITAIAAIPSGKGYWLATSSGQIFALGRTKSYGQPAASHPAPITGIATT